MFRRILILASLCICAGTLLAQDLSNIQIHGFATQGLLYSNHNNYLSANTSVGSLQWTDGGVSLSDVVSDRLRVGIQVHMSQLGQLGGPVPDIDWAQGDYKFNEHLGFRAGKVKTPLGLFNDSQDVDAGFLWALLPEGNYPTDNRDYTLAHTGGDVYGGYGLGKKAGKIIYRGYLGWRFMDLRSGTAKALQEADNYTFSSAPDGKIYGGDVRWQTPLKGLMIGASESIQALDGKATNGSTYHIEPNSTNVQYFQYERGKFYFASEYKRTPKNSTSVIVTTTPVLKNGVITLTTTSKTSVSRSERRDGFFMAAYRVTPKLQVGGYFSRELKPHRDPALPKNYFNDCVASARFDINSYFYFKVEEHIIRGNSAMLYHSTNPSGYQKSANMTVAKLGFSF
jgi:hypothetical protein